MNIDDENSLVLRDKTTYMEVELDKRLNFKRHLKKAMTKGKAAFAQLYSQEISHQGTHVPERHLSPNKLRIPGMVIWMPLSLLRRRALREKWRHLRDLNCLKVMKGISQRQVLREDFEPSQSTNKT